MKFAELTHSKFITLVQCFFMTWALMKACYLDTGNIVTMLFLGLSYLLILYVRTRTKNLKEEATAPTAAEASDTSTLNQESTAKDDPNRLLSRFHKVAAFFALVFAVFMELVYGKVYHSDFENSLFIAAIIISTFFGIALLAYYTIMAVYLWVYGFRAQRGEHYKSLSTVFIMTMGFALLCYLPYFLTQFPGIMTPDSLVQMEQIWGIEPYSNHHPWMHTMLIKLWYEIGYGISKDVYVGIAFYTVFQMLVMAASAAYSLQTLAMLRFRKLVLCIVLAFYALVPYNGVFAVTVWKDIIFSCAVINLISALARIATKNSKKIDYFILFFSAFWMCVGRSNGWYGMLVSAPFLCIYLFKRKEKLATGLVLGAVVVAAVVKWPVMSAVGVQQPDFVESISIPLQEVARVLVNERELTPEQEELIEKVIDTTYIKELYDPTFADNIKELVRAGHPEYLEAHKGEYLKLLLELGVKYPGDYLDAYIQQTMGYYAPKSFGLVGNIQGISPNPYNLVTQPIIGGAAVTKINEILIKMEGVVPIYGLICTIGTMFWMVMMAFGYEAANKGNLWILFVPIFALIASVLIATPVSCDIRYYYFMVLAFPLLILLPKRAKE